MSRTPASPLGDPVEARSDSPWRLRPWIYDGAMNADHFSGEVGFSNNGTSVQVIFRAGGRAFSASVEALRLRDLLAPEEGSTWGKHGEWIKLRADGYAPDGDLRILEPTCHLRWTDNYPPELFRRA